MVIANRIIAPHSGSFDTLLTIAAAYAAVGGSGDGRSPCQSKRKDDSRVELLSRSRRVTTDGEWELWESVMMMKPSVPRSV